MKQLDYKKLKYGVNILKHDYYGFKKLRGAIAQLVFPKGTRVMKSSSFIKGRCRYKLRSDQAITIMLVPFGPYFVRYKTLEKKTYKSILYSHKLKSTYRLGKKITPNHLNTYINESCGGGIHFFCTLKEAENY